MSNLLVVDFDYFFHNPLESGDVADERIWLFDWGHQEGSALHNALWPIRAAGFMRGGFELPQAVVPDGWWDRFNIADGAVCEVSDSNMYSGVVGRNTRAPTVFDHVWLFDAHHDCYRLRTLENLDAWVADSRVTCEDWMFAHYVQGSKLHWRWPRWHRSGKSLRADVPKWVHLDARRDDLGKIDMRFDAVSICRSGSWVPPWCDPVFEKFYQSCPAEIVQVDEVPLVRAWDDTEAQRHADMIRSMEAAVEADGGHMLTGEDLASAAKLIEEVEQ